MILNIWWDNYVELFADVQFKEKEILTLLV